MSYTQASPFSTHVFRTQFHSVFSFYSSGVSILVCPNVPVSCSASLIDPNDRYIVLLCNLDGLVWK